MFILIFNKNLKTNLKNNKLICKLLYGYFDYLYFVDYTKFYNKDNLYNILKFIFEIKERISDSNNDKNYYLDIFPKEKLFKFKIFNLLSFININLIENTKYLSEKSADQSSVNKSYFSKKINFYEFIMHDQNKSSLNFIDYIINENTNTLLNEKNQEEKKDKEYFEFIENISFGYFLQIFQKALKIVSLSYNNEIKNENSEMKIFALNKECILKILKNLFNVKAITDDFLSEFLLEENFNGLLEILGSLFNNILIMNYQIKENFENVFIRENLNDCLLTLTEIFNFLVSSTMESFEFIFEFQLNLISSIDLDKFNPNKNCSCFYGKDSIENQIRTFNIDGFANLFLFLKKLKTLLLNQDFLFNIKKNNFSSLTKNIFIIINNSKVYLLISEIFKLFYKKNKECKIDLLKKIIAKFFDIILITNDIIDILNSSPLIKSIILSEIFQIDKKSNNIVYVIDLIKIFSENFINGHAQINNNKSIYLYYNIFKKFIKSKKDNFEISFPFQKKNGNKNLILDLLREIHQNSVNNANLNIPRDFLFEIISYLEILYSLNKKIYHILNFDFINKAFDEIINLDINEIAKIQDFLNLKRINFNELDNYLEKINKLQIIKAKMNKFKLLFSNNNEDIKDLNINCNNNNPLIYSDKIECLRNFMKIKKAFLILEVINNLIQKNEINLSTEDQINIRESSKDYINQKLFLFNFFFSEVKKNVFNIYKYFEKILTNNENNFFHLIKQKELFEELLNIYLKISSIMEIKNKVERNISSFKKLKWIQRPIYEHVRSSCLTREKVPKKPRRL